MEHHLLPTEESREANATSPVLLECDVEEEIIFEKIEDDREEETAFEKAGDCAAAPNNAADTSAQDSTLPVCVPERDPTTSVASENTDLQIRAVWAMLFCIFTDSVNVLCAHPNFALMVSPGAHPDSFPNTEPFDFAAAQYMIVSAASAGAFVANLGAGWLSDYVGRRRVVLINLSASVVFTLAKYGARNNYWTFVAMAFVNGCFASTGAVGLGYIADMFSNDQAKVDTYMSNAVATFVVGRSAGGLLTAVSPNDLFFPLLLAAIVSLVGLVVAYFFLLDPCEFREEDQQESSDELDEEVGKAKKNRRKSTLPEKIDIVPLVNVLAGSVVDYAGSTGLLSLSLSPLMFETFHYDFVEDGLDPVMSEQAYRLLYSMLATSIVFAALLSPMFFKTIGVALSCVIANIFTGCVTISLLYVAFIEPVTRVTFAMYTTILYVGWSLSATTFLSTGPMLDRITPLEKKGFVQGLNGAVSDGSFAIFPFLFALIVDNFGTSIAFWIATGLCGLAALVNLPLVFHPRMQAKLGDEQEGGDGLDETGRTAFVSEQSVAMTPDQLAGDKN